MRQIYAVLFVLALPAVAQSPEALRDDYKLLQGWRYRTAPVEVPAGVNGFVICKAATCGGTVRIEIARREQPLFPGEGLRSAPRDVG